MSTASSGQQATDSLNGKLTFEQDKNRIVGRDADNLIRLLILADGVNFIMKVAKEGFDAISAADDELIFNSDRNTLKVVNTGDFTTVSSYNTSTPSAGQFASNEFTLATIPHGLGYIPVIIAYVTAGTEYFPMPSHNYAATGTTAGWTTLYASVDATNVYIRLQTMRYGSGTTIGAGLTFKYYLLQETANLA